MANDTTKVTLPKEVVSTVINKVKDTSTIAALSPSEPQKFDDKTYLVFNPTAEAEVVAEGAKKGSYELSTTPIVAKRAKVVTTTRLRRAEVGGRGQPAGDRDQHHSRPGRRARPRAGLHRLPRGQPQGRQAAVRLRRSLLARTRSRRPQTSWPTSTP